jgi:hypothetical protein
MAVRNKNVMMADGGTGYVLPAQPNLANYNKNVNTGTLPKLGTTNYGNVYVPPYANANAQLPMSMESAIKQAKQNLGYESTSKTSVNGVGALAGSAAGSVNGVANKMPSVGVGALSGSQAGALPGAIVGASGSNESNASSASGGSNAAQSRYNNSINALQDAYQKKLAGLQGNLASQQNLLKANLGVSRDVLAQDAERALQEAYINRMMNERSLQQQLNAQGLNGGATESAMASLLNNYGTSRNNINVAYNNNLAELEQAYLANLAQAQQNYNDALAKAASDNANYKMELENALYKAMLA